MLELYKNLMNLCESSEVAKFFYKDFTGPMDGKFRVFSYHYASYSEWLKPDALECRGIMFEMDGDTPIRIASRPMEKFFNLNENPLTMGIDISDVEYIMDKADGSLVSSYVDDGYLYLKSKTSLYSDQARQASALLNSEEYSSLHQVILELALDGYTVNMEFVSPNNRVVLAYQEPQLFVLNVRDNATGEYVKYDDLYANAKIRPYLISAYGISDPTTWVEGVRELEGVEGYIAVLNTGQRFKVKTEWYSALHHTKDSITSNERLFASVVSANSDDLRSLFAGDEYAIKKISAFEQAYLDYLGKSLELCQSFYDEYRGRARKDYAIAAQKATVNQRHLFGVIMNMYEGTVDVDKLLKDLERVFLKYWAGYVPKEYEKEIELSEE